MVCGLAAVFSACADDGQSASESLQASSVAQEVVSDAAGAEAGGQAATGRLVSINGNTLTVELLDMQDMGNEARPDMSDISGEGGPGGGQPPEDGSMPEGMEPGNMDGSMPGDAGGGPGGMDGSMPEGGMPEGEGSQRPDDGNFEGGGETTEIMVDDTTVITNSDGETLALEDLAEGDMLQMVLGEDGTIAVTITVMQMAGGEQAG